MLYNCSILPNNSISIITGHREMTSHIIEWLYSIAILWGKVLLRLFIKPTSPQKNNFNNSSNNKLFYNITLFHWPSLMSMEQSVLVCQLSFQYKDLEIIQSATLGIGMIGHSLLLNITPRLFAINIRATIFGCCHLCGQLGTIICYLLLFLDLTDHKSFVLIQIGVTFALSVLCCVIPDVDGRELPDIIEDMDYFSE